MSADRRPTTATVRETLVNVGDTRLFCRRAGDGDRLLVLLHGWPQTSYCWRYLLEPLARDHTVVAPDLRGYGRSLSRDPAYDKRSTASDLSRLVTALGFAAADVVGHDRGARVAHRWALDRPEQVNRLALLDVLPSRHVMRSFDRSAAAGLWHWFFHLQPELPELLIGANVDAYLRFFFGRQAYRPDAITPDAVAEYVRAFSDPASLHASLEDYRAGFGADLAEDERDHAAGHRLTMPLLVLWGADGGLGVLDVPGIWREYAANVRGHAVERCRHFLPEEHPAAVLEALRAFFGDDIAPSTATKASTT
ncbi:MAG TPA: alpha/beta hydrolase [Trebonia sp.]|jgi:pimeloyl-ACP methyl ester carboxylesterase|nr:alpha/beta hydrolase [Trebonia sp.]